MATTPRFRIAPSPTGLFHVGNARTALFNWLAARNLGGTFVLRVEDTDTERHVEEAVQGLQRAMRWLGIEWDEGPHFQSTNRERHVAAALDLAERGLAYWSDPMPLAPDGKPLAYDGRDRDKGLERAEGRALRFRTPSEGATTVTDLVRGDPTFAHDTIEDFGLLRGNGEPLFLLANVVDDIDMRITHVVRGDDHLSNTPKQLLLWDALGGGGRPVFAHLPMLVNDKRQKLSKRRDKVFLEQFRDDGYLPEVLGNYLCLLGWAPPDGRERFRIEEVVDQFSLADVQSSPAFFDLKKLDAFNGDALRSLPVRTFVERATPWLQHEVAAKPPPWSTGSFRADAFEAMAPLVQTRVVRLDEVPAMVDFLFLDEAPIDDAAWSKAVKQTDGSTAALLGAVRDAWADEALEWRGSDVEGDVDGLAPLKAAVFAAGERLGLNRKKAQAPVRVAITGRDVGPPLFEAVEVLGREVALARVDAALARLG